MAAKTKAKAAAKPKTEKPPAQKPRKRAVPSGLPASVTAAEGTGGTYPLDVICRLLMLTQQRVNQLVREGFIPKSGRNAYTIVGAVQGYIRFLKDDARRSSKSAAQSRLQDVRASEVERRMAREEHTLIETEEAIALVDETLGSLKSEMAGVPARASRDQRLRHIIETEINDVFRRAADRFEQRASDLRQSGEAPAPNPEDDA